MINIYENEENKYKNTIFCAVEKTLNYFDIKTTEVDIEINIVDDDTIKELNEKYRNLNKVTDVLSFQNIIAKLPLKKEDYKNDINYEDNSIILGEIYICEKKAILQANEYGHSLEREISFLVCHGVLHLLGFDHTEKDDEKQMNNLQDKILDEKLDLIRK